MLDPNEWVMVVGAALVRRRDGYRLDQSLRVVNDRGDRLTLPMRSIAADSVGAIENQARATIENLIASGEILQGQEPRTGPESVVAVTVDSETVREREIPAREAWVD